MSGKNLPNSVTSAEPTTSVGTEPTLRTLKATWADFKHTFAPVNVATVLRFSLRFAKFRSRAGSAGSPQERHLKPSAGRPNRTSSYLLIVPPAANSEPRPSPFCRVKPGRSVETRRGRATWLSLGEFSSGSGELIPKRRSGAALSCDETTARLRAQQPGGHPGHAHTLASDSRAIQSRLDSEAASALIGRVSSRPEELTFPDVGGQKVGIVPPSSQSEERGGDYSLKHAHSFTLWEELV